MNLYTVTKRITIDFIHTGVEANSKEHAKQILEDNGAEVGGIGSGFHTQVVKEVYKVKRAGFYINN